MANFNSNIDVFIVKFGWTTSNQTSYISLVSMITPLGGMVGSIMAKYILTFARIKEITMVNVMILIGTALVSNNTYELIPYRL